MSTRSPQARRLVRTLAEPIARRLLTREAVRARLLDPHVVRNLALSAIRHFEIGAYGERVALGAVDRPHYVYCVWNAAVLARSLGLSRMSVVEFGVAGGNGLVALEQHAARTSEALGIEIEVYGFDTGAGLPAPRDYRDLPYHWQAGFFAMDEHLLRSRLERARLVLGEVRDTIPEFTEQHNPAPIGVVMQDLDFYSSTVDALALFDVDEKYRLPRVYSYFDDIVGSEVELYNDFTGERLAIAEFNERHPTQKISPAYHLLGRAVVEPWFHKIFTVHDFDHSRYCDFVSATGQQRTLVPESPLP